MHVYRPPKDRVTARWTGHLVRYGARRDRVLADIARQGPDLTELWFGARQRYVLVSSPTLIRQVLVTNPERYSKETPGYARLRKVLSHGLVTKEGEAWQQSHDLLAKHLIGRVVEESDDAMRAEVAAWLTSWRPGTRLDVMPDMSALTLRLFLGFVFGPDAMAHAGALSEALETLVRHFLLWQRVTIPAAIDATMRWSSSFARASRVLDEVLDRLIAASRTRVGLARDVLDAGVSPESLRGDVRNLLIAGHDTTATTLTFAFAELARDPARQAAIADEAARGENSVTHGVIMEALRLYPAITTIGRAAAVDHDLDGFEVRRGDVLGLSPYVMHRVPRHFEEPLRFDADRLRDKTRWSQEAFVPFGLGRRACIGKQIAIKELRIVTQLVCSTFVLRSEATKSPADYPYSTLRPAAPVLLEVTPR